MLILSFLYVGAQKLSVLIFPQSKWAYCWVYEADSDDVHIEKKPHDCKFMTAPIGDKHCRYERVVSVEKGSGIEIIDWDETGNLVKVGVRPRKDFDNDNVEIWGRDASGKPVPLNGSGADAPAKPDNKTPGVRFVEKNRRITRS